MEYRDPPRHEPTPAEIRQRCIQIQMGWTRAMERSRRVHKEDSGHPMPQTIKFPHDCFHLSNDEVSY